ncbi:TPA: hypothetical protein DCX16_03385 [bacterium]|nr:hypothetical protein [bacterium]
MFIIFAMQKWYYFVFILSLFVIGCKEIPGEEGYIFFPTTKITDNKAVDLFCDVSPDGQYIAFSSNKRGNFDIYIKNINEQATTQRTFGKEADIFPSFSPDGRSIAYSSDRFGNFDIFIMNTFSGMDVRQVTFDRERNEVAPDFSPDGKKILFTSLSKKEPTLMIIDLETHLTTEITKGCFGKFSPDGEKIVFERDGDIWVVGADGRSETLVFHSPNFGCIFPCFSQNGRKIVYTSIPKNTEFKSVIDIKNFKMADIRVVNIDGCGDIQLTGKSISNFPCWSNDGFIYYSSLRDEVINIFRIEAPFDVAVEKEKEEKVLVKEELVEIKKEERKEIRFIPPPLPERGMKMTIKRDGTNIWTYPGKTVFAKIDKGGKVIIVDSSKKWYYKVLIEDGREGWVSSFFVE